MIEEGSAGHPTGDNEVVAALMNGEGDVFAALVKDWSPMMLRVALMHVSHFESAEDVVQESWMAALRGLATFEGRSSLRSWVIGIVFNLARRHGTRERRNIPDESLTTGPTVDPSRFQSSDGRYPGGWKQFPTPWPDPADAVIGREVLAQIHSAMETLPKRQRAVIELRDVLGFNCEEVSEALDLTPGNQRVLLHRARAGIRRELEDYLVGQQP